ncbi:MAG: putative glycoside hydrolase [Patescibacteria group bacterium]
MPRTKSTKPFSKQVYIFGGCCSLVLVAGAYFITPEVFSVEYRSGGPGGALGANYAAQTLDKNNEQKDAQAENIVTHIATPEPLKAIYMTQCVVGTKDFREELVKIADTTEINSILIDIKDFSGKIAFRPVENRGGTSGANGASSVSGQHFTDLMEAYKTADCGASDMIKFIARLHEKGIYVIGRITVFQDPFMTKKYPERAVKSAATGGVWKDFKGLSFVDVGAKDHWDYIIELSKQSYAIGFDELNFDYIRYPSDGNMKDTKFMLPAGEAKSEMLAEFFAYLHSALKPTGAVLSADLFGMTTTSRDDLNIGQVLEKALPHFDYIAPMVYPSHYPKNFNGYANPNDNVYGVIHFAMKGAVDRVKTFYNLVPPPAPVVTASAASTSPSSTPETPAAPAWKAPSPETVAKHVQKLRPWLQDFDYGGNYDIAEVKAQIKATYDAGLTSWMLWSPSNKYTTGALKGE